MRISAVLFDIGNVLSHDGHETYLIDKEHGLTLGLGIPKKEVTQRVTHIFRKYAVLEKASETNFWQEISQALGIVLSSEAIEVVKETIKVVNPEARLSFELLQKHGIRIGIISNSTPFFYPEQAKLLALAEYVKPDLLFLSHEKGYLKSNGLFEIAARSIAPSTTYVIEDRSKNVAYGRSLGFHVAEYSLESGTSLLAVTKKIIAKSTKADLEGQLIGEV